MAMRTRSLFARCTLTAALGLAAASGVAVAQDQPTDGATQATPLIAALHLGTCTETDLQPIADLGGLQPYGQMQGTALIGTMHQTDTTGQTGTVDQTGGAGQTDGTGQAGAGDQGAADDQTGIGDQGVAGDQAGIAGQGEYRGAQTQGQPVLSTSLTLDTPFDDVFNQQQLHAIAIHQGEIGTETIVACGEVGGFEGDGRVVMPLRGVNDSGHAGVAILDDDDAGFLGLGEAQTQVTLYLVPDTMMAAGLARQDDQAQQTDQAEITEPAQEVDQVQEPTEDHETDTGEETEDIAEDGQ